MVFRETISCYGIKSNKEIHAKGILSKKKMHAPVSENITGKTSVLNSHMFS